MEELNEGSAAGPDHIPTKVLKRFAKALAPVIHRLASQILKEGRWPESWAMHWIVPIYKKKAVFHAGNYRGVHLTAQLAKVVERAILPLLVPRLETTSCANQFAYQQGSGARDILAFLVSTWLLSLSKKRKVAVYGSYVSCAFDKVSATRLIEKLRQRGVCEPLVRLLLHGSEDAQGSCGSEGARRTR